MPLGPLMKLRYSPGPVFLERDEVKKILPPVLFLVSVVAAIVFHFLFPIAVLVPNPFSYFGITLILLGLGLSMAGSRKFSQVGTNIKTFNDPDVLVTNGLFKISRNPMYLGFVLALFGLGIFMGSVSAILPAVVFAIVTDRWYVVFEEKAMKNKFGSAYEDYQKRTRRWL